MRALVRSRYGGPEVLSIGELPVPVPGTGELLIEVEAVAVNAGDLFQLTGLPRIARTAFGVGHPKQPGLGRAVAGRVAALGTGVEGFAIGDPVFGETGGEGIAQFAIGKAAKFVPRPAALSAAHAATLPVSGTTALHAVREARLSPGSRVLISGASGGVGSFAVQLARHAGAQVTGVCRASKADFVRTLGADRVIDHSTVDPTALPDRYDAIIDLAGAHPVSAYLRILERGGRFVLSTGAGGSVLGPLPRMAAAAFMNPFVAPHLGSIADSSDTTDLATLAELTVAGSIRPAVDRVYAFEDAVGAFRDFAAGRVRGKVVVAVAPPLIEPPARAG